jgi:hypothetical protein
VARSSGLDFVKIDFEIVGEPKLTPEPEPEPEPPPLKVKHTLHGMIGVPSGVLPDGMPMHGLTTLLVDAKVDSITAAPGTGFDKVIYLALIDVRASVFPAGGPVWMERAVLPGE